MGALRVVVLLAWSGTIAAASSCTAGQQPPNGPGSCENCPPGHYKVAFDGTPCDLCGAGNWTDDQEGQTACWLRPTTTVPPAPTPLPCAPGSYLHDPVRDLCHNCPPGNFSAAQNAAESCEPCANNTYAGSPGSTGCAPCAPGTWTHGATGAAECEAILSTTAAVVSTAAPSTAAAATTTAATAATTPAPTPCGAGTYVKDPVRPNLCESCSPGHFSTGGGAAACQPCAEDHYWNGTGGTQCDPCGDGNWTAGATGAAYCTARPTTATAAPLCGPGQYRFGPHQCEDCAKGHFSNQSDASDCEACGAGFYAPERGAVNCTACPAGEWTGALGGQSACVAQPTTAPPAPTTAPTAAPTLAPTAAPTLTPTGVPTLAPTAAPTPPPVDCVYSAWSGWTPCSEACVAPAPNCTADSGDAEHPWLGGCCDGLQVSVEPRSTHDPRHVAHPFASICRSTAATNNSSRRLAAVAPPNTNATDRGGYRWRVRDILVQAQHGGVPCPSRMEDKPCNRHACGAAHEGAPATCDSPPEVDNAGVAYTGLEAGSRATYSCGAGFELNGYDHADCFCSGSTCQWTSAPRCHAVAAPPPPATPTPAPTPHMLYGAAPSCDCDPLVNPATDVSCALELHTCQQHGDECNGHAMHTSMRVYHNKDARMHAHHRCQVEKATGDCMCCDCDRNTTAADGCPCGAAHHFFGKRWQFGYSPYWWTFRPKPGTTTCEIRGEMVRMGRHLTPGDVFFTGSLSVQYDEALRSPRVTTIHRRKDPTLHIDGVWTELADSRCPPMHASADPFAKLELLAAAHPYNCGAMSFQLKPHKDLVHPGRGYDRLTGSWYYTDTSPTPWQIEWTECPGAPANATYATHPRVRCSAAHKGVLADTSLGTTCGA